ncbi:MAG: hypothetical protein Q8O85_07925 [Rhodoferax sp.]|uniref:hypothetical protein n=1 Tax=Rhodoferax sp. TaxID=50421 RepID=UPI00273618AD|nr:hypothetical protein [Rhodoferax sp.]MDP2678634.1 hypothetical protein [Rhodoferax sp.]
MNDWSNLKDGELLLAYASLMEELRTRGIVRSSNNPVGDFTEFLVARALGLNLLGQSAAGHDATDASGVRYQIKGRRPTEHNKSVQLGIMRNLEFRPFDVLAAVIYSSTFSVSYAALIPIEVVSELGSFSKHSNGQVFHFRRSLLNDPRVTDITVKVSATQQGAPADVLASASLQQERG